MGYKQKKTRHPDLLKKLHQKIAQTSAIRSGHLERYVQNKTGGIPTSSFEQEMLDTLIPLAQEKNKAKQKKILSNMVEKFQGDEKVTFLKQLEEVALQQGKQKSLLPLLKDMRDKIQVRKKLSIHKGNNKSDIHIVDKITGNIRKKMVTKVSNLSKSQ